MAVPSFVKNVNVKFDGTLTPVLSLYENAGNTTYIVWDDLDTADQERIAALVDQYGGVSPLVAAVPLHQTVDLGQSAVGANPSGLYAGATVAATLFINGALANDGVTYTAVPAGSLGNAITVAHVNTGIPSSALSVGVVGNDVTVNLATDAGVAANLTVNGVDANGNVTYTANKIGTNGNLITVEHKVYGLNTALSVDVHNDAITVNVATSGAGAAISTATEVAAAVNASANATALLSAAAGGTGASVVGALAATNLANGAAVGVTSTSAQVVAAVAALPAAAALVTGVAEGTGADVAVVQAKTNLAGGATATTYTVTITFDTTPVNVSIPGSSAGTFTALITALNTALGANGTASISAVGDILIEAATAATMTITLDDLFMHLTGYVEIPAAQPAATTMIDAFQGNYVNNNTFYSVYQHIIKTVGAAPALSGVKYTDWKVYWNGTNWIKADTLQTITLV